MLLEWSLYDSVFECAAAGLRCGGVRAAAWGNSKLAWLAAWLFVRRLCRKLYRQPHSQLYELDKRMDP